MNYLNQMPVMHSAISSRMPAYRHESRTGNSWFVVPVASDKIPAYKLADSGRADLDVRSGRKLPVYAHRGPGYGHVFL